MEEDTVNSVDSTGTESVDADMQSEKNEEFKKPSSKTAGNPEGVQKQSEVFISPTFAAPKRSAIKPKRDPKGMNEEGGKQSPESSAKNDSLENKGKIEKSGKSNEISKKNGNALEKKPLEAPFKPPTWCSTCSKNYSFEILKNGVMKGEIDLTGQPFYLFGRLAGCDVVMEHPSISRFHAVVVYKGPDDGEGQDSKVDEGFYIMDLGSTHGTVVNKIELKPRVYHRLRVGYVVKFGGSTRLHILQGPQDDQDEEKEMKIIKPSKADEEEGENMENLDDGNHDTEEDEGISWGMAEDAVEEEVDLEKLLASRKPLELKDPKKTLRGFFEREGLDLEYESDERGTGHSKVFVVRVKLPIEDANGEELIAEGTSTKKKDAVVACAYEACRIIDAHGMLRNAVHESESSKRAKRLAENDFYDSDDDSFLDRTGAVESKRSKRMKKAGKDTDEIVETYESLKEKLENCRDEISTIERSLDDDKRAEQLTNEEGDDDLDNYMSLVSKRLDKKTRIGMKHRLASLRKEERRIERLLEIVKPTELPTLKQVQVKTTVATENLKPVVNNPANNGEELSESDKSRQIDKSTLSSVHDSIKNEDSPQPPGIKKSKPGSEHSVANESNRNGRSGASQVKSEKKKIYGPQLGPTVDCKFADWVPPKDQTGDGKTHLNEKFGY